ncbi:zinc finger protein 883-like isoform X16 [Periplaneta americana]|uniref:zinc finger protein 883-like isoform X16 n=1 Tax=Periplaneta americana TaxID=6978 RepID=UPI0037E98F46
MLYVERENSGHLPNGEQEGDTSEIMETSIMEGEEYYNQEGGEWTQKVDTGQLCRVCANPNDYLIPIFDGEGLEHELSMKIQKHLPIKVTETDTLPQHMCYQCASTLIAWHDLVISCVEADKKLRELQMEENDDDDDKGGEMFESPSLDSEMTDDVIQPSTSETQNQNQVSKTPSSKKAAVAKEKKSKLKMILVKGPPAGTSGQKTASKTQVAKALELAKSKDGVSQDSASERCHHSSKTSFRAFHEAKLTINNMIQLKSSIAPAPDMSKSDLVWIKTEVDLSADSCEFCDSVFSRKRDLADHLAKVHEEYVLHCEVCDSVFKHKYLFEEHMKLHEPNIECSQKISDTCSNSSGHDSDSHIHLNTKGKSSRILRVKSPKELNISGKTSEQVSYGCETCGKHFKRLYHLNKHIKTHDTFMKVEAGESETGMSGLGSEDESCNEEEKKEERETTEKKEKTKATYHCQICGKNFTLKDSFKSHQRIHTGEKPFTCHICGKQFSHTGGLYYHLKHVHAGIKNHSCDICGRSFALKAAMEDHRRIHTGERPYVCHTCGKSFKTKASLYIHSKIHTDSFPHSCTYCERRFRWRQQLLAHLTTHTGEKPHSCEICGKSFGVKNDLTRHKLIHSDDKPFVCPLCGLCFGQKRYLKNHEKSRHVTQR